MNGQNWRNTNLQVISRERSGIFGAAILWIMLFHSSLQFQSVPLHLIKSTGYAGVDLFFFLSGVGLYYSMEKDPSPRHFYKKRALRVLIPYLIVALLYEGLRWGTGQISGGDFLRNVTLLSYWQSGYPVYWFIAAILVFYLVYPLLYRLVKSENRLAEALLLAGAFGAAWLLYQNQPLFYRISGFVFRIPVFLVGCYLAPMVKDGRPLRTVPTLLVTLTVAAVCLWLWAVWNAQYWYLRMYLFLPMSIALILFGSIVLSLLPADNPLERVLLYLGGMTLEIYLVHEKWLAFLSASVFPNHAGTWEINGLAVLLSILTARGLVWLTGHITKRIS